MPAVTIGKLATVTGTNPRTIRYYENIGLLPAGARSPGGHRLYSEAETRRLTFIRHARDLGFSLENIRDLLALADKPELSCQGADALAGAHLQNIQRKIRKLTALQVEITRMMQEGQHGKIAECRVIEVLNDHAQCQTEH